MPRGGARSITTGSSETDRYHSTFTPSKKDIYIYILYTWEETFIVQEKSKPVSVYMGEREMAAVKQTVGDLN